MGLDIRKNEEGLYNVTNTISDHSYGMMSEKDVKLLLIGRAYEKFMEEVIKIDFEFPSQYSINGKRSGEDNPFFDYIQSVGFNKYYEEKPTIFKEITKKFNLEF